jgi:L-aspartate oxidase
VQASATSLIIREETCVGARADGRALEAGITLLAAGGAGALWSATTNAPGATGDGIALGLMAGAQVADLEFMQFHPTALATRGAQRVLLTEALRGHGATLIDANGERFVDELAPRHVVAKAILDRGEVYLDCRHIDDLEAAFPTVTQGARANGFDPVSEPLPVEPAAHYFIGGVAADANGRTSIPGLFAAGECAATGMHGANRLAGNSLLETVVVGRRVGSGVVSRESASRVVEAADEGAPFVVDAAIPAIMWKGVGPIRDEDGLQGALTDLAALDPSPHRELCEMVARAARARPESRGVHIRSDYPESDESFATRSFDQHPAQR